MDWLARGTVKESLSFLSGWLPIVSVLLILLCSGSIAFGQVSGTLPEPHMATEVSTSPFVTFEHHGYFRFRSDLFGNAFLSEDAGGLSGVISGFAPPFSRNAINSASDAEVDSDDVLGLAGGANIRLRWNPTLSIGTLLKVHAQIDVLDNLVLGSTPEYGIGDPLHPLVFFSESQASPSAGINSFRDAVRVKRAWGEWTLLNAAKIEFGRLPNHWGLGMVYNDGDCEDCDFGDSVDGAFLTVSPISDITFRGGWFFPGEGALFAEPDLFFGQPYDGTTLDDVHAFVLDVYNTPQTPEEKAFRERALVGTGVPFFDWGLRNVVRIQDYASDLQANVPIAGCPELGAGQTDPTLGQPYECTFLLAREAFFWTSDLWLKMDWRPSHSERFLLEMELAGVFFSQIGQVQGPDAGEESEKEFWAGAGVVRATYQRSLVQYGLEVGAATGDDVTSGGIWDRSTFIVPVDGAYTQPENAAVRNNDLVSGFVFNRAYNTDLLLFRQVMGAVTNTIYTRPWIAWDFLQDDDLVVGVRGDFLYAAAMVPEGTPGQDRHLGLEVNGQLYLQKGAPFRAVLEGGYLYPLGGLDSDALGLEASPAWTVQGRVHVFF